MNDAEVRESDRRGEDERDRVRDVGHRTAVATVMTPLAASKLGLATFPCSCGSQTKSTMRAMSEDRLVLYVNLSAPRSTTSIRGTSSNTQRPTHDVDDPFDCATTPKAKNVELGHTHGDTSAASQDNAFEHQSTSKRRPPRLKKKTFGSSVASAAKETLPRFFGT